MKKYDDIEKEATKKFTQKDKRKKPKMHVSGRSVFKLKEIIKKKHDRTPKRKSNQKNR